MKVLVENRSVRHNYTLLESFEAGLVLQGTEIKSLRLGKAQLKDSYISFYQQEAFIKGMHITQYKFGNRFNHEEERDRKLLLHKEQIRKLFQAVKQDGLTVVPVKLYLDHGLAKLEIALARGKKLYDKRQSEKERDAKRTIAKAMKGQL